MSEAITEEDLNLLGADGWELVTADLAKGAFVFKRELPGEPESDRVTRDML